MARLLSVSVEQAAAIPWGDDERETRSKAKNEAYH
jgi:hypothetical protein